MPLLTPSKKGSLMNTSVIIGLVLAAQVFGSAITVALGHRLHRLRMERNRLRGSL